MKRFCFVVALLLCFATSVLAEESVVLFKMPPTDDEVRGITNYTHRVFEFVADGPFFNLSSIRVLVAISPLTENFKYSKFQPTEEWGEFLRDYEYIYATNWGASPIYMACRIHRRATPLLVSETFVVARLYIPGTTYYSFRFLEDSLWDGDGEPVRGAQIFARDPSAKIRPDPKSLATTWGSIKFLQ
ncbi:MAG: hypothetical protein HY460_01295 [Parcubacteria group bacterium]|nr:hypothetical protein [Parcubacteria group bacterium]